MCDESATFFFGNIAQHDWGTSSKFAFSLPKYFLHFIPQHKPFLHLPTPYKMYCFWFSELVRIEISRSAVSGGSGRCLRVRQKECRHRLIVDVT